jgi:hypothetical protein
MFGLRTDGYQREFLFGAAPFTDRLMASMSCPGFGLDPTDGITSIRPLVRGLSAEDCKRTRITS